MKAAEKGAVGVVEQRKRKKGFDLFHVEPYFVMRTPLLPVSGLFSNRKNSISSDAALDMLRITWSNASVQEGIYLASPSLYERLRNWHWQIEDKKDAKLAQALYRYVSRMHTRPTPFGLFAAVSLGRIGADARLEMDASDTRLHRHTRLDTATIAALGESLTQHPGIRKHLRVRVNDCGHRAGSRWHYVDWHIDKGMRTYTLSSVAMSEALESVLSAAMASDATAETLADTLCRLDPEIDTESALEFIFELIDNKLLLSSLEPCLTGRECLPALIDELESTTSDAPGLAELRETAHQLAELDSAGPGSAPAAYAEMMETLAPIADDLNRSRLVQVDLYRDVEHLQLPASLVDEIAEAAEVRMRLGAFRKGPLDDFCRRFTQRYEGRRVSLLEALDEESGIESSSMSDVPSPLLDGVAWRVQSAEGRGGWLDRLLLRRWHELMKGDVGEIVLEPDDVPAWDDELRAAVAPSSHVMVSLIANDPGKLESGDYSIVLHGMSGPSVANMLGRFCFGSSALADCVRSSLAREAKHFPGAIMAEVVHLPQARLGNLARRPLLRDYEIPVLGRSGASEDRRISLDDLDVEVRGQHVLLWSRRLNKRVIPRMSNAHNFDANSIGIYRFLCQVQHQGVTAGQFSFGPELRQLPRLPRVRYGRVVLSPAQWRLGRGEFGSVLKSKGSARLVRVAELRESTGLPRLVGLVESDNVLTIDLENDLALDTLCREVNKLGSVHLMEVPFDSEGGCVRGDGHPFAHEIIVPLRTTVPNAPNRKQTVSTDRRINPLHQRFYAPPPDAARGIPANARMRLPGSDWLYYRLFGGSNLLDRTLVEALAPMAERLRGQGICDRWFFIRYGDPSWHLRLRFQGEPQALTGQVVPQMKQLLETLLDSGWIERVDIATYDREIERYGGPAAVELCERWFAQDSWRVAALLKLIRAGDPHWRWQIAITYLVNDLRDFGLDQEGLTDLFTYMAGGFLKEFGMSKQRLATVGTKYRDFADQVQHACTGQLPNGFPQPGRIQAVLGADAGLRRDIGTELRTLEADSGSLWGTSEALLPSLVHMTCNRMFLDTPRAHEMVLYELIRRGLVALDARRKSRQSQVVKMQA